jgi:hypothetical protein
MRRPSPAMLVAVTALVVALSGTAVAATGGDFILGKANKATSVTSLSDSAGTALALSAPGGRPPLTVSNSTQVRNLNASYLDGDRAGAFLPVNGTAANSTELGGQPASAYLGVNGTAANSRDLGGVPYFDYVTGGEQVSSYTGLVDYGTTYALPLTVPANAFQPQFICTNSGTVAFGIASQETNGQYWVMYSDGTEGGGGIAIGGSGEFSVPSFSTTVVQVAYEPYLFTLWLSTDVNTANDTCTFAVQSISNG